MAILAKNKKYSLHRLASETYKIEAYVLIENNIGRGFGHPEHEATILLPFPCNLEEEGGIDKLILSIKNGGGVTGGLYPLSFVGKWLRCPATERAKAIEELCLKEAE